MDFRFVHLSDLHFAVIPSHINPLPDPDLDRLYKAAWILGLERSGDSPWSLPTTYDPDVAVVLAQKLATLVGSSAIDGIIVTGDVATTGNLADLRVAKGFLTGTFAQGTVPSDLADGFMNFMDRTRVVLLPGNHDRYSDCFLKRSQHFEGDQAFGPSWCGGYAARSGVKADSNCPQLRYAVVRKNIDGNEERLILVQMDFSLMRALDANSVFGVLGQGYAYIGIIRRLTQLTSELRSNHNSEAIVWLCHFPPEAKEKEELELRFGERLSRAAKKCGVPLLLAGHIHKHANYNPPGSQNCLQVISSGSATNPEDVPSFNEITISVSRGQIYHLDWKVLGYEDGAFVYTKKEKITLISSLSFN
jgi:UDP-2,3-diacylglucosamine pyrophosphatase LpxH